MFLNVTSTIPCSDQWEPDNYFLIEKAPNKTDYLFLPPLMWSEPEPSTHWDRLLSGSRQVSSEQSGVMGGGSGGPSYTPSSLIELLSVKDPLKLQFMKIRYWWEVPLENMLRIFCPYLLCSQGLCYSSLENFGEATAIAPTDFQSFLDKWKLSVFNLYLDKVVRPFWY